MRPHFSLFLLCLSLFCGRLLPSQSGREVVEHGGSKLVVDESGMLFRVTTQDLRTPIGCTSASGPGKIHDMVRDPRGGTFVAAQNGLFMISSDVDVLDPCDLRDGVPDGVPLKLRCSGDGRLFVKTTTGFGVIDTSFFFGRSIVWKGEIQDYVMDEGPMPTIRILAIDRGDHEEGRLYKVAYGARVLVAQQADARGGATFRYRRHGHHLWYPLDAEHPYLPVSRPGKTAFDIVALDQDLRRSKAAIVHFEVPYPVYFSKLFLLGTAGISAVVILLSFAFLAWINGGGKRRFLQATLSSIAAILLGIQILTALFPHAKGWPFVGFSMYTEKYDEFALLYQPGLWAESAHGDWFQTHPTAAGRVSDGYWQGLVPLVHGGDAAAETFLDDYNERHPDSQIQGLMVQETRTRLTSSGPVRVAPVVMARYRRKPK